MGAPPCRAILPGVRHIWVASYGCGKHPEYKFTSHRSTRHQSTNHWSTSHRVILHHNQLHQASVNQVLGNQAPVNLGNLSLVSQALCYQAPVNQAPGNRSPVNQSPVNQAMGTSHRSSDTRHQSLVIQAPVIMRDYQGLDTSHQSLGNVSDWRPGGHGFDPHRGRQHSFVEIDHEIFSTVILSLLLIQEGQLSVSGESMCTILVNRLED